MDLDVAEKGTTPSAPSTIRGQRVPPFTHPLEHEKTSSAALVDFDGVDDRYRGLNWPVSKKAATTVCYGLLVAMTTWSSSIYASAVDVVAEEVHVSTVVASLGTALYLFGMGVGPLLWAPISEVYGRKNTVQGAFFVGAIFSFGWAAAKDVQTLMLTRFFSAFFASAPLVNTGGVLADLYTPQQRAAAMAGYQLCTVGGPLIGPIVGGAFIAAGQSWRWTGYLTGILMLAILAIHVLYVDESYGATLLVRKAQHLRSTTHNWSLHAAHEEWNPSLEEMSTKYLIRPFRLLLTPICFAICLYCGFVYSLIYLIFSAQPIEFQEIRGWGRVTGALPALGTFLGCIIGLFINMYLNRFYIARLERNAGKPVPEMRLLPMMVGGIVLAAALFIFAWTSSPRVFWIAPVIGLTLMGVAFITIFQASINYLVDTFQMYSASAVAANTVVRSMLAGCFPIFADAMYHNLGVDWASSMLGFIAIVMIPIPFLFYVYGYKIRAAGEWSRPSTL